MLTAVVTVLLLTASPAETGAWTVNVRTLDGRALAGELISLDGQQVVVRHDGQDESVAVAQLLAIELPPAANKVVAATGGSSAIVRLRDDSQLGVQEFTATPAAAALKLADGNQADIPTSGVAWVRFPSPAAEITAEWERILTEPASADVLVVRKQEALDYLEGIVRAVKNDVVDFEFDGEVLQVKRAKVEGIRYFHRAGNELPASICRVVRPGGAELQAAKLRLEDGRLELYSPAGLRLRLTSGQIQRLDFSQGKVVYLSDLDWDPQLYERQTYFGGRQPVDDGLDLFPPQRDRALDGGPLELDRRSYSKGLALHSRTRLVYRLPSAYRRLLATAGLDDRVGRGGDVRLVIEGDGRELFAANLRGGEQPTALDLDIAGVKRLSILADFGLDLDISDHLDLVEARVVK